jgi:hypothetical protein
VCPGTVDERVEEVVAGKRHIADLVLPKSSSLADLDTRQLRTALGLRDDSLLTENAAELGHDVIESVSHRATDRLVLQPEPDEGVDAVVDLGVEDDTGEDGPPDDGPSDQNELEGALS